MLLVMACDMLVNIALEWQQKERDRKEKVSMKKVLMKISNLISMTGFSCISVDSCVHACDL